MSASALPAPSRRRISPLLQFRVWHFGLLVAFTAIAIVDIQGYCQKETALIALAAGGYAAYALLCWLIWHAMHRFERRLGSVVLVAAYAVSMGALFLASTIAYLLMEYFYLGREVLLSKHRQKASSSLHRFVLDFRPGTNVGLPIQLAAIIGEVASH